MPKDVTCVTKVLDFPVLSTNFWRKTAKVLSTKKKVLCRCLPPSLRRALVVLCSISKFLGASSSERFGVPIGAANLGAGTNLQGSTHSSEGPYCIRTAREHASAL